MSLIFISQRATQLSVVKEPSQKICQNSISTVASKVKFYLPIAPILVPIGIREEKNTIYKEWHIISATRNIRDAC